MTTLPLFLSYRNTPYCNQTQTEIFCSKKMLSELQKIHSDLLEIRGKSPPEHVYTPTPPAESILENLDAKVSWDEGIQDEELEKLKSKVLQLEKKLKDERKKTKIFCSQLLKSLETQFETRESLYKKQLQDLHNLLGVLSTQAAKQKNLKAPPKTLQQELSLLSLKTKTVYEKFQISLEAQKKELEEIKLCWLKYPVIRENFFSQS